MLENFYYNKWKAIDSVLIDGAHTVINEIGTQKKCEEKDLWIVIFIFIEGSDALTIDKKDFQFFSLMLPLEGVSPKPEPFSARVDSWSDSEPLVSLVDYDSVEEEWFPCAVFPCDRNNSHSFFDWT